MERWSVGLKTHYFSTPPPLFYLLAGTALPCASSFKIE